MKTNDTSGVDYRLLYLAQAGRCFYCKTPLPPRPLLTHPGAREQVRRNRLGCQCPINWDGWTRDHFLPRADGNGRIANTVLSCEPCNHEKSDNLPTDQERQDFSALQDRLRTLQDSDDALKAQQPPPAPDPAIAGHPTALTVALENALRQKEDQSAYQRLVAQASGPVPVEK